MFRPSRNPGHLGKTIKFQVSIQIMFYPDREHGQPLLLQQETREKGQSCMCHLPHHQLIAWLCQCYSTIKKRSWVWHWICKDGTLVFGQGILVLINKLILMFLFAELRRPSTGGNRFVILGPLQKPWTTLSLAWGDRHWVPDNEDRLLEVWTDVPSLGIAFFHCRWMPAPWTVTQRRENFATLGPLPVRVGRFETSDAEEVM